MGLKWNAAQLSAIMTREKNILVSAAAGSGKTAVLTERIKQLITKEHVSIDEMLIVTFTNAAAGEMRERIYKGIEEAMEEEDADLIYLQDQIDRIGNANISTFHAFCLEIIRSYFYMTDLTPDFRICDDAQKAIFTQKSMEKVISEFFEKRDDHFLKFVTRYSKAGNERGISVMIEMLYSFIQSLPKPMIWLEEKINELKDSDNPLERETCSDACVLRDMVIRYDQLYTERKIAANMADFNDVEHLALRILENPEPCNEYREKFKHIFVDEYQDTNGVQEELISRIKRENNLFMVGDVKQSIYQFRLADPDIFIGKYRSFKAGEDENSIKIDLNRNFRSKTPVLEATNRIMSCIMTEDVSGISYDEDARLYQGVDFENTLYEAVFREPAELHLIVENEVKEKLETEFFGREAVGFGAEALKKGELEALFTCSYIKDMIGREYFDAKENRIKTIDYKDIVILMRSYRGVAEVYQDTFQEAGIPAYVEGGDGYFDTVEVSVFINLIKLLTNKRQDIPLLSVLHSVIFGFSANEIAGIRGEAKTGLFADSFLEYACSGEEVSLKEKCNAVLEQLEAWREESQYLSLKDFLWKLAEESGYYTFIQALPMGTQRRENIKLLINKGEIFQKNTSMGLPGFAGYLEQLKLSSVPAPEKTMTSGNDNVVRIMSIHKSKGLEFPVVIVTGLGKRFNHRKPSGELSLDRHWGIGLRYRSPENEFYVKTERQIAIDRAVKEKEIAEEMRILYVAMTRAKEKLILLGSVRKLNDENLPGEGKPIGECSSFVEWLSGPFSEGSPEGYYKFVMEREIPEIFTHSTGELPMNGKKRSGEKEESVEENSLSKPKGRMDSDSESCSEIVLEVAGERHGEQNIDETMAYSEAQNLFGAEAQYVANDWVSVNFKTDRERRIRDDIYEKLGFEYKYKEASGIPAKFTATGLNKKADEQADYTVVGDVHDIVKIRNSLQETDRSRSEKFSAAEIGTLTHKVLQELDINAAITQEALKCQIKDLELAGKLPKGATDEIKTDWIWRFLESELGRRIKAAQEVQREKSFLLWESFDDDTGSLIQGVIDCFFEEPDGLVLVDYKTDYLPKDAGAEQLNKKKQEYETQVGLYKKAIEESYGKRVKEAYLYFLSVGKALEC